MWYYATCFVANIEKVSIYHFNPLSNYFGTFETQFYTRGNDIWHKMQKLDYLFIGDIRSKDVIQMFDNLETEAQWTSKKAFLGLVVY